MGDAAIIAEMGAVVTGGWVMCETSPDRRSGLGVGGVSLRRGALPAFLSHAGSPYAFYYAPTPSGGFTPAANLSPEQAADFMLLAFYTLVAQVQAFLPHMLTQGEGAILLLGVHLEWATRSPSSPW
jgi:hypothetical protein